MVGKCGVMIETTSYYKSSANHGRSQNWIVGRFPEAAEWSTATELLIVWKWCILVCPRVAKSSKCLNEKNSFLKRNMMHSFLLGVARNITVAPKWRISYHSCLRLFSKKFFRASAVIRPPDYYAKRLPIPKSGEQVGRQMFCSSSTSLSTQHSFENNKELASDAVRCLTLERHPLGLRTILQPSVRCSWSLSVLQAIRFVEGWRTTVFRFVHVTHRGHL